jgi:Na+-driven multidrug efflux pump
MPLLRIKLKDCRYNHKFMKEHLKIAIPMAINFSILSFSMMIIQSVCNSFGTEVIAGFTAAMRIEQISVQPLVAIGIAIATYTAQNYGATLIKRIRKGVRQSLFVCLIISIIISVSVRLFGTEMIASFIDNKDQNIIHIGKEYLLISSYFYFFLSCIFITRNTLQGMGNATFPLASSIIELIIRAYSAIYLANIIGYYGIFWAGPIAWIGGALVTLLGYFWIILRLNPKAIRQIYLRNRNIKKFSI